MSTFFSVTLLLVMIYIYSKKIYEHRNEITYPLAKLLFYFGIQPTIEQYSNGELIGWGYFRRYKKLAYYHHTDAFILPLPNDNLLLTLHNKRFSDKLFL